MPSSLMTLGMYCNTLLGLVLLLLSPLVAAAELPPTSFAAGERLHAVARGYYDQALIRPSGSEYRPDPRMVWPTMQVYTTGPLPGERRAGLSLPRLLLLQVGSGDMFPIGVHQNGEYLFDFMGNGRLSGPVLTPTIPYWVLYRAGGNPRASDRTFLLVLDTFLEGLESPGNPYLPGSHVDEVLDIIRRASRNPNQANRDLYFHLQFAILMSGYMPEQVYYAWMYLGSKIYERYSEHHPLPAIQLIRYAHRLERAVEAQEWISFLQGMYRGTVAAQIYDTLTDSDEGRKTRKQAWVLEQNPDHWWVIQEFGN